MREGHAVGEKLTLGVWHGRVGYLPPLLDHLAFDLATEGSAPANAVAEAVRTLDLVARKGRTEYDSKVPFRTQHACRDALSEWEAIEFLADATAGVRIEESLMRVLDEAADSMVKATVHEPIGKPGGPGLWKHKGLQLPAYIQHIANDIHEKRGKTTSEAIAIAIGAVKRWAAGGGNVDAGTKAAAKKALAEWTALKASHNKSKSARESDAFVNAVSRLKHTVGPIKDGATFAVRYGNRLQMIEGVLPMLKKSSPVAVKAAASLLESTDDDAGTLYDLLSERKMLNIMLCEALGYGSTAIRARTSSKNKGRFHGMHGVEKAVKKRSHIAGPTLVTCPSCSSSVVGGAPCPNCGSDLTVGMGTVPDPVTSLIMEAAPMLAPPAPAAAGGGGSAMFEQLHPRAVHGQFGSKPGEVKGMNGEPAAPANGNALADAIRANDPEYVKLQAEIAQSLKTPTGAAATAAAAISLASDQVQNIGYADTPAGISQFQKDYGLPVNGQKDATTIKTISNVYAQNAKYAASQAPDFTGIKGAGAKVRGKAVARKGRSTIGKTAGIREAAVILGFADNGTPFVWSPAPGENHANGGDSGTRQPGGDDFDFDENGMVPPGLREREGSMACDTCVHFVRGGIVNQIGVYDGCALYSYPVDRLDVCDTWLTLTPPDAPLVVQETRLRVAMEAGNSDEVLAARAAIKVLRPRFEGTTKQPHPANADVVESLLWLEERDFTAAKRRELASKGHAMKDGSFPIEVASDVKAATHLARTAEQRAHVKKRAKAVGASDMIPDTWE